MNCISNFNIFKPLPLFFFFYQFEFFKKNFIKIDHFGNEIFLNFWNFFVEKL